MGAQESSPSEVVEAMRDLARGRVHRSRHDLAVDGSDTADIFRAVLAEEGYRPMKIRDVAIERGLRFPAFLIRGSIACFGHVFIEKFSEEEARTLFGSVVRDWRGDWEVMLTRRSAEVIWIDFNRPSPFDEDHPSAGL